MTKILGLKNLLSYLETVDYPMTEQRIEELMAQRTIPHSRTFNDMVSFDIEHIDWWVNEQRKNELLTE